MRQGYLHVCVAIDVSESTSALREDARRSLNEFITRLRYDLRPVKRLDVYQFSERRLQLANDLDVGSVSDESLARLFSFQPSGASAINDALCQIIDDLGRKFSALAEGERPERVLVVVVTDGRDNYSSRCNLSDLWARVTRQSYEYSWEFSFILKTANELRENCPLNETIVTPVENAESVGVEKSGFVREPCIQ